MTFFYPGHGETTKGAIHFALGGLAAVCCGYSVIAWCLRRESHLARNAVIYGGLTALEAYQVSRHRSAR